MAENPYATIHKITDSLRPSRIRVETNDKLAKVIFKLSDEGTEDLFSGDIFCIVEKRDKTFVGETPLLLAAYIYFYAVNGDNDTLIFFTDEPPLLKMAQIKKQLVSYDATILDMTGQNTPMNIASKNYTMLRIQEIIPHKQLTPTITFGDVFKKLRIENADNKIKQCIREYMIAFFEHLKSKSIVKSF